VGGFGGALPGLHFFAGRSGGRWVHGAGGRHYGWGSAGLPWHYGASTYCGSYSRVAGVDGYARRRGSAGGSSLGEYWATAQGA
jgi:hypothetical protein